MRRKVSDLVARALGHQKFSVQLKSNRKIWNDTGEPEWLGLFMDKSRSSEFASHFGLKTPRTLAHVKDANELLNLSGKWDSYVVKPNAGAASRGVYVVVDGRDLFTGSTQPLHDLVKEIQLDNSLAISRSVYFIIEEFVRDWDTNVVVPRDYKFYTFGGEIAFLHIIERVDRCDNSKNTHWFLNEDWKPLGVRVQRNQSHSSIAIPKPPFWKELNKASKLLSERLGTFVRVDLYAGQDGPVFGEFAPFPHAGDGYTREGDRFLSGYWHGQYGAGDLDKDQLSLLARW